jgi:hypothetical protein
MSEVPERGNPETTMTALEFVDWYDLRRRKGNLKGMRFSTI